MVNTEKIEILESLKKITISEDFAVLKKNIERVLSALIKNKYPDISESLKKNKEQTKRKIQKKYFSLIAHTNIMK